MFRALVSCIEKVQNPDGSYNIKFSPIFRETPEGEEFFVFLPDSKMCFYKVQAETAKLFKIDREYYLDFLKVE